MPFTTFQLRRGTAAEWTTADSTLAVGELGYETDTGRLKIGDGASAWASLAYFEPGSGGGASVEVARYHLAATTGSFTTTLTTLPFDTADQDPSWAKNTAGVVNLGSGTYQITADVTIDESAGSNRTEFESVAQDDSSGSYVTIGGTVRRHYSRNNAQGAQSASMTFVLVLASAANVRIQSRRVTGSNTGQWLAGGSAITVLKLA